MVGFKLWQEIADVVNKVIGAIDVAKFDIFMQVILKQKNSKNWHGLSLAKGLQQETIVVIGNCFKLRIDHFHLMFRKHKLY